MQNQQRKVILTDMGNAETLDVPEGCVTLSAVVVTGTVTVTELAGNTAHSFTAGDEILGEELPVLSGNDRYKAFQIVTDAVGSAKVIEVR